MLDWLKGKKTYIVMIVGVLVNGAFAMGYLDDKTVAAIDGALMFLGMGSIRAGISKGAKNGLLMLGLAMMLGGCAGFASLLDSGRENSSIIGTTGLWISIGLNPEEAIGGIPLPSVKFGYGTVWRVGKHDDVTVLVNGSAGADGQDTKGNSPTATGNASLHIRAKNDGADRRPKPVDPPPSSAVLKEVQ